MAFSTTADFDEAYRTVRVGFQTGITKDKEWRRRQLKRLWWMIEDNKDAICQALSKDLSKHSYEALLSDYSGSQNGVMELIQNLDEWTADEKPARTNFLNFLGSATIRREPLGVTLIIAAWNYPFYLIFKPMAAAIAAGCAMILKPSDAALASQEILMDIIPKYMDPNAIRIISAGPREMDHILKQRFDHIFYTGSSNVAKIIHAAAAKHLTPVTLELGGQGPAIVDKSANIEVTAKRIAGTKFMNAGQICLNVNHILVDPAVRETLVDRLIHYFDEFSGGGEERPSHYTHVINDRNYQRLENLLLRSDGKILYGGERDPATRFFAPTIVLVKPGDSLLSEEIFGPILPIMELDFDSAIAYTAAGEHPLAIYGFTTDPAQKADILSRSMSGGVTFNDCILHAVAKDTPFGGVGNSGTGSYHGRYGIATFSHLRPYIEGPPAWMEGMMSFRYPPYTPEKVAKASATPRPPFDREGNDISSPAAWLAKWGAGLATVLGVSYAVWTRGHLT